MRAMPSFTSSAVPTSRTSISARSAAWISLRRISLSSPGRRMESVAMGSGLEDCESYHKSAEYHKNAECGVRNAELQGKVDPGCLPRRVTLARSIPHSEFHIPHWFFIPNSALRALYARPRPSSYESLKHASRPHRPQFLRGRTRHTPRRPREMAGGRVAEDVHHRPHGVPGIAQQIGGTRRTREIDDPLEVGGAAGGELARQVLSCNTQRRRHAASCSRSVRRSNLGASASAARRAT